MTEPQFEWDLLYIFLSQERAVPYAVIVFANIIIQIINVSNGVVCSRTFSLPWKSTCTQLTVNSHPTGKRKFILHNWEAKYLLLFLQLCNIILYKQ